MGGKISIKSVYITATVVCVHPGSSCKEQTAGIFAEKLAKLGYVTIVFDASFQGESEG
nr:alpha/beta hydrolase [Fodinibius saliphilus]